MGGLWSDEQKSHEDVLKLLIRRKRKCFPTEKYFEMFDSSFRLLGIIEAFVSAFFFYCIKCQNEKRSVDLTNCIKNLQICLYFCGNDDIVAIEELF